MDAELKHLQIDRTARRPKKSPRWIVPALLLCLLLGAGTFVYARLNAAPEVRVARVRVSGTAPGDASILNATGYIVAAHKIELAAKVVGKVAWIGVDKGDKVREDQELVRLEDDEYRAHLLEAQGQLNNLKAHLAELEDGSRPEEIARANADLAQARASQENARVTLDRTRSLAGEGVLSKQALDDAQAKYDAAAASSASLDKAYELVRIGPRHEEIDAMRAQVRQAQGTVDYAQTQLDNTVIRAPISGTILERNVEKGEFVTTGFVGDKGAKGYVVSLADLDDLQVELDISQNDFAKLGLAPAGHRHHRRVPRPQVQRLHRGDRARGQPPEGHRAGESEDRKTGWLSAARNECQCGVRRERRFRQAREPGEAARRCARRGRARSRRVRGGGWQGCAPKRASADWWRRRYRGPAGRFEGWTKSTPWAHALAR